MCASSNQVSAFHMLSPSSYTMVHVTCLHATLVLSLHRSFGTYDDIMFMSTGFTISRFAMHFSPPGWALVHVTVTRDRNHTSRNNALALRSFLDPTVQIKSGFHISRFRHFRWHKVYVHGSHDFLIRDVLQPSWLSPGPCDHYPWPHPYLWQLASTTPPSSFAAVLTSGPHSSGFRGSRFWLAQNSCQRNPRFPDEQNADGALIFDTCPSVLRNTERGGESVFELSIICFNFSFTDKS
jgi:hypothetical protein